MLKSPISPLADFRIFGYFLLLVSALVILIPSFHKYSIELFTLMGTMFVVVIGAWRIRVMYAFYIILIICPFLQGRSLFGIYGLNASNLIFIFIKDRH